MIFVSDGQRTWIYSPNRKEYMEVQGGAAHRDEQPGSSQGTGINPFSQYENLLVNRFRNLSTYSTTAVVEKEGNIKIGADKVKCYIVKIESPTGKHELWVDENRFLVLRSIDTSPTPQEGIATQTTVTFDVKEVNLSAKLEDALFSFAPPENAKKVDVLKGLTAKTP
jgi:outer membrane lipoprotein-sorting protein